MSEQVTVKAVDIVDSLGIPGIGIDTFCKIESAQEISEFRRQELCKKLGIPITVDRYSLGSCLPPEVFKEIKKDKSTISEDWRDLIWLMNEEVGLLLVDGRPAPLSNVALPILPKWTRNGDINLTTHMPLNPKYASVMWKMEPNCGGGQEYSLPSLSCTPVHQTSGHFPLSNGKIHVFGGHSYTLVKTYEPWLGERQVK